MVFPGVACARTTSFIGHLLEAEPLKESKIHVRVFVNMYTWTRKWSIVFKETISKAGMRSTQQERPNSVNKTESKAIRSDGAVSLDG